MIEELKMVLDAIGDLSGIALWVVDAFIAFKLIVYLSTTGAIVYCFKLAVERLYGVLTNRTKTVTLSGLVIHSVDEYRIREVLSLARRDSPYLHRSDFDWMESVLKEAAKTRQ